MARGKSGRVVLEIDPELKRQLYFTLEYKQQTMKEWFIEEAQNFIGSVQQDDISDAVQNKNKRNNGGDE